MTSVYPRTVNPTPVALYMSLTYRQTVELLRRLNGGTVGFNYGPFKIAELRTMIETAIADGTYEADQVDAIAGDINAQPAAQPFAQTATPARALPKLGGGSRPAPVAPAAPAPAPAAPAWPTVDAPLGTVYPIDEDGNQTGPATAITQEDVDAMAREYGIGVAAPVAPAPQPLGVIAPLAVPLDAPAPEAPAAAPAAPVAPRKAPAAPKAAPQPVAPANGPDAPARMPLSQVFPRVKLPALAFTDCPVYAHPDAPIPDPHYIFDADALAVTLAAASAGLNIWAFGPPGTGKTEFVRQFAARTGRPFYRVQCDRNLERSEFIGSIALENGNTVWVDAIMLQGFRTTGAVLCIDEITYVQQGNVAVLNGLLEPGHEYRIAETGERVVGASDVVIFACDNTNGTGDASGLFVGTSPLNVATTNRFGPFIRFDYLNKANEAKVLRDRTGISKEGADAIANLLHVCRQKAETGAIASAPTLREAMGLAMLMAGGISAPAAFETIVAARAIPESQEELRNLFSAHWPAALNPAFAAFTTVTTGA